MLTPIMIELPEPIYQRVERTAKGLNQPIPQAIVKIMELGLPSLAKVPPQYHPELESLETVSDHELRQVAESSLELVKQKRLTQLLTKRPLTNRDKIELEQLRAESNRLLIRKSWAYLLLKWRGQVVPNLGQIATDYVKNQNTSPTAP